MKEKDLKETIGKKLEEAYLAKPMGQAPSEETVAKWIAIADQRRAERRRRKKKIISCAAACALCVCIGVTCVVKPPNAVAGGSGGGKIEAGGTTTDIYKSESEIPHNLKEEFLTFPYIPAGYIFVEAITQSDANIEKLSISYMDSDNREIFIEELKTSQEDYISNVINSKAEVENWDGMDVYINEYTNGDKETVYTFVQENILVEVKVPIEVNKEEVKNMIKKAAQI